VGCSSTSTERWSTAILFTRVLAAGIPTDGPDRRNGRNPPLISVVAVVVLIVAGSRECPSSAGSMGR
jgi:hypothetical protein